MTTMTEKEFIQFTMSVNKALNPMESPLKMKHARSVIITTYRTKECKSFWQVVMRQHLMENRFTAWKFCHLLHKVLREGHPSALRHSQTHKKMILEVGKLWGHLHDGVGNCIHAYSKLLVTKLEFHEKNAFFPGQLILDFRELQKYTNNDINLYFQLGVEIFDYLDDIIDVEVKVFTAINNYRMSSMTPQGQCRLAPLITLIQDSNPLYDMCVRIMFKLHDQLPNDLLVGHRERFRELFIKLKQFYDNARPLQYFADLIQVPHLPDHAPNFQSQVDFGTYIPPVVLVQPDPEPVMEQLIDMDNNSSSNSSSNNLNPPPTSEEFSRIEQALQEREQQMQTMQYELATTRDNLRTLEDTYHREIQALSLDSSTLSAELTATKELCAELKKQNEELNEKLAETPVLLQKSNEEMEKAKTAEEKFNKLKTMYSQIREEHINLLRQQGESTKLIQKEKKENERLTAEIEKLRNEELAQATVLSAENERFIEELKEARMKNEQLQQQIEVLKLEHKEATTKLQSELNDLVEKNKQLQASAELNNKTKAEQQEHFEIEVNALNTQVQLKEKELAAEKQQFIQLKEQQQSLQEDNLALQKTIKDNEIQIQHKQQEIVILQQHEKEQNALISNLLLSISEHVLKGLQNARDQTEHSCYTQALNSVQELSVILSQLEGAGQQREKLAGMTILLGQQFTQLHLQTAHINSCSADIATAQSVQDEVDDMLLHVQKFCRSLCSQDEMGKQPLQQIRLQLEQLQAPLQRLEQAASAKTDLGDLVVNELAEMDKTIAEATNRFVELLSQTRSKDEGIKLEVNGKILDACTALMECLKLLIERARQLQEEIVSIGRGSTSVKEFYKRNSQWSEGLISAAKSVARGANVLFDAADKATSVEKPVAREYFHILVAAQEIAAYTAQLVVASKVKAPKESERLSALQQASRSVSTATGAVVATVRDCNKFLETPEPIDITKLTSSQAKTMEMEIHVRVLELEQALHMQRLKLASFRRKNYQNTED